MALPELRVFYRSNSHAPLWVVAEKPGSGRGNVEWRIRGNFYRLPRDIRAERAGAHVILVRAMSIICGVTLTTTMSFVKNHKAKIPNLIRGFVDALHFFVTRKQETLEMLKEHTTSILLLRSDEEVEALYEE
jgi:hypothetical protein